MLGLALDAAMRHPFAHVERLLSGQPVTVMRDAPITPREWLLEITGSKSLPRPVHRPRATPRFDQVQRRKARTHGFRHVSYAKLHKRGLLGSKHFQYRTPFMRIENRDAISGVCAFEG